MTEIDIDKILNDSAGSAGPAKSGDNAAVPVLSVPAQPLQPTLPAVPVPTPSAPVMTESVSAAPSLDMPAADKPAQPAPEAKLEDKPEDQTPISPAAKEEQPAVQADASLTEANKLRIIGQALKNVEKEIATIIHLLESNAPATAAETAAAETVATGPARNEELSAALRSVEGRVIEGVFDGQNMVGSDGKIYTVPANYASKSKLVEGDMLKLTITPKGSFIYKQIGPIERSRVIGNLGFDPTIGEYYATTDNRRWSIIKASVTYYKGDPGDEVVLLVPKNAPSKWAAVENIIKRNPLA